MAESFALITCHVTMALRVAPQPTRLFWAWKCPQDACSGRGEMSNFRRYHLSTGSAAIRAIDYLMSEELLLAAEYRKHAKALRAAAKFDREAKTSLVLKRIAEDYEQMAKALEVGDEAGKSIDANLRSARS